jgi:hypothetical protein
MKFLAYIFLDFNPLQVLQTKYFQGLEGNFESVTKPLL